MYSFCTTFCEPFHIISDTNSPFQKYHGKSDTIFWRRDFWDLSVDKKAVICQCFPLETIEQS